MQVVYSLYAEEKLTSREAKKLGITKERIERVIGQPDAVDSSEKPVLIAVGKLTRELTLNGGIQEDKRRYKSYYFLSCGKKKI